MNTRLLGVVVGLMLVALAVVSAPIAFSQMEPAPLVYTYVSQFQVPRANWAAYSEDTEKSAIPILEKMTAEGTILGWSTFEQVIHTTDGYTHGAAWTSTSIAGPPERRCACSAACSQPRGSRPRSSATRRSRAGR